MADKERPSDGSGSGGDEEEDGGVRPKKIGDPKEGNCRKAKKKAFFGFKKGKKNLHQKRKQRINSGCWAKRDFEVGYGCFLSLKKPDTDDSSSQSPTSDPNSEEFTVDILRALIEKNDFYSEECNPHLDTDTD
ncbi:unnamed protein product [Fraxinus pennsylvanica]|uniref:Uncharacterized protein n=1 Tax=Fraxinus pennsylvanica TaxID=56036 RepID=A0AAD2AAP2_9LAMI|nr:unnamed protein product [Fraxinus pennsylvanica]